MKKKIVSIILSALLVVGIARSIPIAVSAEAGTVYGAQIEVIKQSEVPDGYTGIYTKEDLDNVRDDLSGNYILMNNIVFNESDFSAGGLFYNGGTGWQPIGSKDDGFMGTFDGNGYVINGIQETIKTTQSASIYAGLFGLCNGTITNLGMVGGYIDIEENGPLTDTYTEICAGGIVGYMEMDGIVSNCYNEGTVTAQSEWSAIHIGGIVGYIFYKGMVSNCYNDGYIAALTVYGNVSVGGVIGEVYYSVTITNCHNIGMVQINIAPNDQYINAENDVGGICGKVSSSEIQNCFNLGVVYANSGEYSDSYAGGIAGNSDGSNFNFCYNRGAVFGENYAGGIAALTISGQISDCFNDGQVVSADGDFSRYQRAGGIVGDFYGNPMVRCCNLGSVAAASDEYDAYAGGIAGYISTSSDGMQSVYNTGKVSAISNSQNAYSGGIAAYVDGSSLSGCYNNSITEAKTYYTGTEGYKAFCGNIIGYRSNGTLSNCCFISNGVNGVGFGGGTTKSITVSAKSSQSSYSGFDFTNDWIIPANNTPCLRSLYVPVLSIGFLKTTVVVEVGYYDNIAPLLTPINGFADLTYTTSNSSIAEVDEAGDVIGNKVGSVTITVKDLISGKSASCTVKITNPLQDIHFPTKSLFIKPGQTKNLDLQMSPSGCDGNFEWESNDPCVTVGQNGNVTAVSLGTATITVTDQISGLTASCKVNVVNTIPGDTTADGILDLKDVTMLSRMIAGWSGLNCDSTVADVNADNFTDLKDVTLLLRYIAGWNVELKLPQ